MQKNKENLNKKKIYNKDYFYKKNKNYSYKKNKNYSYKKNKNYSYKKNKNYFYKKNRNYSYKKNNIYYILGEKRPEKPLTTAYLHRNKKIKTGIFLKKPSFKTILYPFHLNLKLINEYLKKK
uniref:Uncharacterized protein n=1 Tax=Peronospora effusa TaxID=542832 RepID=A0A3Q8U9Q8_9STRA|nr:hypothetical protein [Peronospora effusa]AZL93063.1 hypothetical protein [Peronospora effusa]